MVYCVNTQSPLFKEKAKQFGISEGQLENIAHEYGNQEGNNGAFPSDGYIQEKLNGVPNYQASELQAKVWNEKYFRPIRFANASDMMAARQTAEELFGKSSVGVKEIGDGTFELRVAQQDDRYSYKGKRVAIEEQDKPYITEKVVISGTNKSITGITALIDKLEEIRNIQGPGVPVNIPYSSWKTLDMPYNGTSDAKTLLGTLAVMANDWNNERFDYNKKNKTISVPRYWYEVAQLLSKNKEILNALEELDKLFPEDFSDRMSDSDFQIIDGYYSGDYGTLELLFAPKSDLDVFVNAGMISFSYEDSRQGSLFDSAGNALEKQVPVKTEPIQLNIREENMPFYTRQLSFAKRTNALYNNEIGLTTVELDYEAAQVANWISDQITDIQEHPEKYYETWGKEKSGDWANEEAKQKDIDKIKNLSRRDIASNLTFAKLVDAYKNAIFVNNEALDELSGRDLKKASLLGENADILFELGRGVFANNEGYAVVHNDELGTIESTEIQDDGDSNENTNPEDGAQIAEENGNLEDWMVDKTTMEVLGTASAMLKAALGKMYVLDKDGNIQTDYLGRRQRVSQNDVVKSIIRWIQGSQNVADMVSKLEAKKDENPWIQQILSKLNDTSGREADFISQFFSTFDKHFQLFDVVKKQKGNNGKLYAMDVNSRPALNNIYNHIVSLYTIGEMPLFTSKGVNRKNLTLWGDTVNRLKANAKISLEQFNQYKEGLIRRFKVFTDLLGYDLSEETINKSLTYSNFQTAIEKADGIYQNLNAEGNSVEYKPFTYKKGGKYISGYVKDLLGILTESVEDTTESSFYENGKMRQSNQIPSYATKLFQKLTGNKEVFQKLLDTDFRPYEWFTDSDGTFRLPWLNELSKMDEATRKKMLVHKINLNFRGDQYMRGLSPERYTLSVLTEFASGGDDVAFYGFPIQSNKASSDFLSFRKYNGDLGEATIINGIRRIFGQEISRIQTVRQRNRTKGDVDFISGFDERGRNFCLLDFLNDPTQLIREGGFLNRNQAEELHSLIEEKIAGKEINEARLTRLLIDAIKDQLNQKTQDFINECKSLGLVDAIKGIEGVIASVSKDSPDVQVEKFLRSFVWNDAFAKMNIIELLVTDPAYYKNDDDFQKRFAQVHSPGVRGNRDATDYQGNPVTDGNFRAVILKDGDVIKANILDNLNTILDRDIEKASDDTREATKALKESILDRMSKINVTDGQAYSSLTATRKKGFIFGTWSQKAERAYNNLKSGKYDLSDLETAFNVEKPFVYAQLSQNVHQEGTPLQTLKVPTQFKDSEYLLVMAGALLQGQETGKPNLLKVINEVMEESAFDENGNHNNKGLDIFVFESGTKSGLTGISDVTTKWFNGEYEGKTAESAERELKNYLVNQLYAVDENGVSVKDSEGNTVYNDIMVKQIPVEDYAIQNKVPLHMLDSKQIWGSQMRSILESNLPYVDYAGNPVTFSYTDSKGETHSLGRNEFIQAYEQAAKVIADEAVGRIKDEFNLDGDPTDRRISIARILQNEITKNPGRYGNDLLLACTVDEEGNFRIPPGDPIQSKRIEQLVNSVIKNRLNKPKVDGGLGVQVSNFGTSKRLSMRFFDKRDPSNKTLLDTKDEWLAKNPDKTEKDYKAFCDENQGGYAYEENYAPAHTKDFFRLFTDRNGNVDLEAIEMLDEGLLYSIDQRTPTEFYYSISVAKIVGFMPLWAGDGFMRPYEITEKDDSDFDVDKETKWKKNFTIERNKTRVTNSQIKKAVPELEEIQLTEKEKQEVIDMVENRLSWSGLDEERYEKVREKQVTSELEKARQKKIYSLIEDFRSSDIFSSSKDKPEIWKKMKEAFIKLQYKVEYPTEGAKAAMNDAWEMSKAVMQHEANASKVLSPGGPAEITAIGKKIAEMKGVGKKGNMNLVWFSNQLEYYRRNNDASSNLGIFAVANTAHNILEGQGYGVESKEDFTIADVYFSDWVELEKPVDNNGTLISKTLGGNVGAAADAAKTPSHSFMNINGSTINEFLFLIRGGMDLNDASMFIASRPIERIVREFNKANVSGYKTLDAIINERLKKLTKDNNITKSSRIYREDLSKEEIVEAVESENTRPELETKVLLMFQRIRNLTGGMRGLTFATRYNSVASAVGPQIVDNLIHRHQVNTYASPETNFKMIQISKTFNYTRENDREVKYGDKLLDESGNEVILTPFNEGELQNQGVITIFEDASPVTIYDVLKAHPMLQGFSQGYELADQIFKALHMPAQSQDFINCIEVNPSAAKVLYGNKKILSQFSDFYQSYLLIAGDVISTENSKYDGPEYFINKFPKDFISRKDKYAGNPLVDAITLDNSGNKVSLRINTTGMKGEERAILQSGWNQLYKQSPELALMLFKYNFWKGGIGFSPKTFMNLLPIQMKENIEGYNSTFSNAPYVNPEIVVEQFFLNNVKDNKIVRRIDNLSNIYEKEGVPNTYTVDSSRYEEFKDLPYFKFQDATGAFRVFKVNVIDAKTSQIEIEEVMPLGNNGEYLEISKDKITKSVESSKVEEERGETDFEDSKDTSASEPVEIKSDAQIQAEVAEFMEYLKGSDGKYFEGVSPAFMEKLVTKYKKHPEIFDERVQNMQKNSLKDLFERNGITYSDSKIDEIVKMMC